MTIFDLIDQLGVTVEYRSDLPPGRLGAYLDDTRRIIIRTGLTAGLEMETLYHEYVHAKYRDRTCDPSTECRARFESATMLVDPAEYQRAERINPSPAAIAKELGVSLRIIESIHNAIHSGRAALRWAA